MKQPSNNHIFSSDSPGAKGDSGKHPLPASRFFGPILRNVSVAAWILRLAPIPVNLLSATLTAAVVSHAVEGQAGVRDALALLGVVLALRLFQLCSGVAYQYASSKALHRCKMLLYEIFLNNPFAVLYQSSHGATMERLNEDFDTITGRHTDLLPGFASGILTAVVYFLFLARQNIPIAAALAVLAFLQLFPPLLVKRYMQVNYDTMRDLDSEDSERVAESYYGFSTIKLYNLKEWYLARMKAFHKRYLRGVIRMETTLAAENVMDNLLDTLLRYGAYGVMGLFVLRGWSPMETAVEAIALSAGFFGAVKGFFDAIPQFAVAKTAEQRVASWFEASRMGKNGTAEGSMEPEQVGCVLSRIEVRGVTLSFEGSPRPLLDGVSFSLAPTKITLLQGANGSGKSTLLRAMLGMVLPSAGEILYTATDSYGRPLSDVTPELLFAGRPPALCCLPQENAAFHISPRALYRMADCEPDACSMAARFGLTEELLDQPLDTLSGGERKKAFLSLLFAKSPRCLVLDEPGNSLDEAGRLLLRELLKERAKRGLGAILISHDELLLPAADEIYRIREGGISRA